MIDTYQIDRFLCLWFRCSLQRNLRGAFCSWDAGYKGVAA
jgi:hypothetical protein